MWRDMRLRSRIYEHPASSNLIFELTHPSPTYCFVWRDLVDLKMAHVYSHPCLDRPRLILIHTCRQFYATGKLTENLYFYANWLTLVLGCVYLAALALLSSFPCDAWLIGSRVNIRLARVV